MYGYYYGFDYTYVLVLIGAMLCMWASYRVNSVYNKYSHIRSASGMTGAEVAQRILDRNGVRDVRVEHVSGNLTDHYDPRTQTVNLSDAVYGSTSVAALGVAAHECGHVMQHESGYMPLKIRTALVPAANLGSQIGLPLVIIGLIFGLSSSFIAIGIWIFALAVLFQIVTLPVEFNASHRALVMLEEYGILGTDEVESSRKVLGAAAMTYVAAAASAVLQLLRLIMLGRRRDD
ncbi:MAG: zinc metallopeptidase [Butyrivibrio sp.]|nr:zinc metallopeptidase [Butyrivibrio sp.]